MYGTIVPKHDRECMGLLYLNMIVRVGTIIPKHDRECMGLLYLSMIVNVWDYCT